ncbi:uncharacterized protein LOC109715688 isoform X1 [Ananas comosus]|uniref:Chaperone protein DnaJ n=1 Tax=Ananas comosus TaxID=4615 RepID=A0A199VY44_ANACO|nr:uncharacterized protein LOC109715688 isoform X1 [Ananas comosus]OAY81919.1 Chaperone protein DnaJ [Ananas comosus]
MKPSDRKSEEPPNPWRQDRDDGSMPLGILLYALIGATATTVAVGQLRRTVNWFYSQLYRSESYYSWGSGTRSSYHGQEARRRYYRRVQEMKEDERERVERIKRMQSVFNRERTKSKQSYETWRDYGPGTYQHFPRDDWYWKSETFYGDQRTNSRSTIGGSSNYLMSHHYSVLGLDRSRSTPYSDAEIKNAFRQKAMEYHPDQNQNNKEAAEAKFKEVMTSYEAIKVERKTGTC